MVNNNNTNVMTEVGKYGFSGHFLADKNQVNAGFFCQHGQIDAQSDRGCGRKSGLFQDTQDKLNFLFMENKCKAAKLNFCILTVLSKNNTQTC